tara:strand:- start:202 stop:705 length:504 start_codon:yes stop_codon:yes gene_type:complete
MNKKGFLLGEYTLKIVIAIISLLLLIYLLFTLYSNYEKEKNERMAKATLDSLIESMESAKSTGYQELTLLTPSEFRLFYFKEGENRPLQCEKDCLCLCKSFGVHKGSGGGTAAACLNPNGQPTCKTIDYNLEYVNYGEWGVKDIKIPVDIKVEYVNNKFTITKNENE